MLRDLPALPDVPAAQRGEGVLPLRYEDVTQDARLRLEPISHAIGAAIWRGALARDPLVRTLAQASILPILARLRVEGGEGPISVLRDVRCVGTVEWVRTVDDAGRVRLRMDAACEVIAPRGRTHGPRPEGAGEPIVAGRILAEHVLTRPFAAKSEDRQVSELPGGWPEGVPLRDARAESPTVVLALPDGAEALGGYELDPCPTVLGLDHTDSNQHVNSLVYPRLIEEAALRRLRALGIDARVMARALDLAFRKPCFAGDRVHVLLRAFRAGGELGVLAAIVGDEEAGAAPSSPGPRAHAFARMRLAP